MWLWYLQVKLASQYYFYMETQIALAIPDEDNTIVVYSSSQYPELAQTVIAKCLGIPLGNVRVITRRVGGGFGGKAYRSFPVRIWWIKPVSLWLCYICDCNFCIFSCPLNIILHFTTLIVSYLKACFLRYSEWQNTTRYHVLFLWKNKISCAGWTYYYTFIFNITNLLYLHLSISQIA